jgi:hypothetical protein
MNDVSMALALRRDVSPMARGPIGAIPWRAAVRVCPYKRVRRINAAIHSHPSNLVGGASQLRRVQGFCNLANLSGLPIIYFHVFLPPRTESTTVIAPMRALCRDHWPG